MSKDKQFFVWSTSNNCSILNDISLPCFYSVVIIDTTILSYDVLKMIILHCFPNEISRINNLFLSLKDKGNIIFSQYTKDIAETKIMEVIELAIKNNVKIEVSLKKNITKI